MSNAPAFFDIKKMDSLSSIYFKNMDDKKYINYVNKFIDIDLPSFGNRSNELLLIYKPQIAYAKQLNDLIKDNFLSFGFEHFSDSVKEIINTDFFKKNINCLKDIINNIQSITLENGNDIVNKVKEITGLKGKELYMPIRIAAIGKEHGPEMNKILYIIGKEKILENINNFN
ncbi:hypothetical protein FACS189459_0060 [Bacilli bacterium]|nr:hypothetical protein FACS189459_0060 [Bacilli bacterium]